MSNLIAKQALPSDRCTSISGFLAATETAEMTARHATSSSALIACRKGVLRLQRELTRSKQASPLQER